MKFWVKEFPRKSGLLLEAYPQKRHQKRENLERKYVSPRLARIWTLGAKLSILLFLIKDSYFLAYWIALLLCAIWIISLQKHEDQTAAGIERRPRQAVAQWMVDYLISWLQSLLQGDLTCCQNYTKSFSKYMLHPCLGIDFRVCWFVCPTT